MRYTPNGQGVTSFSIASCRKYITSAGEQQEETAEKGMGVKCRASGCFTGGSATLKTSTQMLSSLLGSSRHR